MRRSWIQSSILLVTIGIVILALLRPPSLSTKLSKWTTWRSHGPSKDPLTTKKLENPYEGDFLSRQQKYSNTLVIAKTRDESVSWTDELNVEGMDYAVYTVDDNATALNVLANKGHEAMVYLTYIIDYYDVLPDVSMFMHAHGETWHNNDLLNRSSVEIVQRLSLEKVVREGYVNLRCHLDPGCPGHLSLNEGAKVNENDNVAEVDKEVASAFRELFPYDKMPDTLSQACCAQFAASKDMIRSHPKQKYEKMRDWLIETELSDVISGRFFEFSWHYIFTSLSVFCPSEHLCYCDAFAVCFPTAQEYKRYHDLLDSIKALQDEHARLRPDGDEEQREELWVLMRGLSADVEKRRKEALEIGSDPGKRHAVLLDAWELLKLNGDL